MISLEMAKKLKAAGLEWEPKFGDGYYFGDDGELHIYRGASLEAKTPEGLYFAPRLDQMLAEIYETYNFTLHSSGYIVLRKKGSGMVAEHFHSDTLENAAASALLWIYEGRGGERYAVYPMVNEKSTSAPGIHPMAQWAHRCLPLLRVQLGPKGIRRILPFLRAEIEIKEG